MEFTSEDAMGFTSEDALEFTGDAMEFTSEDGMQYFQLIMCCTKVRFAMLNLM
jgi:hypothetical protein